MAIEGSATTVINAPIARVYAVAADVEGSPRWQPGFKKATVVERGPDGAQTFVETEVDGKVRTMRSDLRFTYAEPSGLSWNQEKGDLKTVRGAWAFEDLGENRTQATYTLYVDFGRTLGLIIRGPLVDLLRGQMCDSMPGKLKAFVEAGK